MSVTFRDATVDDAEALSSLGRRTFVATFGHLYAPEDLDTFLSSHDAKNWEEQLADPAYASRAMQHHAYVARGEYADQLTAWRERFPAERTLVISYERFFADPETGYAEVLRFLGLPDAASPPRFKAYNARPAGGMAEETRARLRAHFAEPNRRLEEYLGTEMGWASGAQQRAER